MKTINNIFIIGVGLLIFAIWGCSERAKTIEEKDDPSRKVKLVNVSPVKAAPPRGSVEYVGMLSAHRKVNVSSEAGGTIEKLYFEKGDSVREGQLLAEVSTSSIRLEVRVTKASLEEAEAVLVEAENNFKRINKLYETRTVSTSKFDSAKRSAEIARANLEQAKATLSLAEDRLGKSKLHAPCDGIMAFRDVENGEVIPPGTTITQVVDLHRLKIKVSLGEKDIHVLEKYKRFSFTVDAIHGETFSCSLSFLSPAADVGTRSFPAELIVNDPDPRMADGMTVRVNLPVVDDKKTIKVPSAWLSEEEGEIGLYVVREGKAFFKKVTLGAYYDQRVEILSGLTDEELVITNPSGLKSGDPVRY